MLNRDTLEQRDREAAELVKKHGNAGAASRHSGLPERTIRDRVNRYKARMDGLADEEDVEYPEFPPDDRPVEEILDAMAARQRQRADHASALHWFPLTMKKAEPIGVAFVGDPHLGNNGTNIDLVRRDVSLMANTPGVYAVNMGDTVDNWGGRLIRVYAENDVSRSTEQKLARWFLQDSGIRWLLWLLGNHDCHLPDTEALTRRGWVKYDDIRDDDQVLSFIEETGGCEWSPILKKIVRPHDGEIVEIDRRSVSLAVTPNHRVLCKRRTTGSGENRWSDWRYEYAKDLSAGAIAFPVSAHRRSHEAALSDDQIRFAGWFLTDGTIQCVGTCKSVTLYQSKCGKEIERILESLGLDHSKYSRQRHHTEVCGRPLVSPPRPEVSWRLTAAATRSILDWLPEKGGMPSWAADLSDRQFDVLLDAIVAGDGTWDGADPVAKKCAVVHGTKEFLSSLQAEAVQHGWCASLSIVREKDYRLNLSRFDKRMVDLRQVVSKHKYAGLVWCLRVPRGNFMVRRNGRAHFSGNSMDEGFAAYLRGIKAKQLPLVEWSAKFRLCFPNGCEVRVDAAHNHKGSSMWNNLHGQFRASRFDEEADIYIAGHHHDWGVAINEPYPGRVVHMARARGYKFQDHYAHKHQFHEQQFGSTVLAVIDPRQGKAVSRIRLFPDLAEGCEFLTWKRARNN